MSALTNGWEPSQAHRSNSTASSAEVEGDSPDLPNTTPPTTTSTTAASTARAPAPSDKTISCVSCRRRKLKCDRVKPKCGTCTRLRHDCEFPERKRNLGSKRRNMKELEARLAQVETQLIAETKQNTTAEPLPTFNTDPSWNTLGMDMDINLDFGNTGGLDSFDISPEAVQLQNDPLLPMGDFFSQELLALGLQEPLPPQDMMDDLNSLYFETYHKTMPIMHKYRYYASLDRAPHMRPPVCLRYAMWAMAASISDKYSWFEDILYERARRYLQQDEMKGHGEAFVSVYYVQAWSIIAAYEATKTYFSRSWMSSGRCVRLCHMLGLHRLDGEPYEVKRIIPVAKDWIELEERRRAFWAAFYVDRWSSSGTGWPMIIDEQEIMSNMPSSEDAFENGVMQPSISLAEALTPQGASKVTPFGGIILSATLFGHNFQHLHKVGPNENPQDLANGEFWKRHRKMDNVLSNTFMFLPDHLRLPTIGLLRDVNIPLIHMNIHASTICLHQAAILSAEKHKLDPKFKAQCRSRSLTAAEEIVNVMRMTGHFNTANLSSWTGFCLYVAAGVLVQDQKLDPSRKTSLNNLEFLLRAMKELGKRHHITNHFTAQLELDIDASGIRSPFYQGEQKIPNTPINGILAERQGNPMAIDEFHALSQGPGERGSISTESSDANPDFPKMYVTPMTMLPVSSRDHSDNQIWDSVPDCGPSILKNVKPYSDLNAPSNSIFPSVASSLGSGTGHLYSSITNANTSSMTSENTPPSDSSSPNVMQYPIRQNSNAELPNSAWNEFFATDTTNFMTPADQRQQINGPGSSPFKSNPYAGGLDNLLSFNSGGLHSNKRDLP